MWKSRLWRAIGQLAFWGFFMAAILLLAACLPTPNNGKWKNVWYYDDNRGVDVKQDKPRIDPKNNSR